MDPIWFYSKSSQYGWLSNFDTRGSFDLEGERWPSVEHYYQAKKFEEKALHRRIREARDAIAAKKLGDSWSDFTHDDWDQMKEEVMRTAVRAKFQQNRKFRELLAATGTSELIHQSSSDTFWGRSQEGEGANRLGEILMEVRASLTD